MTWNKHQLVHVKGTSCFVLRRHWLVRVGSNVGNRGDAITPLFRAQDNHESTIVTLFWGGGGQNADESTNILREKDQRWMNPSLLQSQTMLFSRIYCLFFLCQKRKWPRSWCQKAGKDIFEVCGWASPLRKGWSLMPLEGAYIHGYIVPLTSHQGIGVASWSVVCWKKNRRFHKMTDLFGGCIGSFCCCSPARINLCSLSVEGYLYIYIYIYMLTSQPLLSLQRGRIIDPHWVRLALKRATWW